MEDDDRDIDLDDIDLNLYDTIYFGRKSVANYPSFVYRSDRDEESFSETKIRLDDDEGYEDDGQGIHFTFSQTTFFHRNFSRDSNLFSRFFYVLSLCQMREYSSRTEIYKILSLAVCGSIFGYAGFNFVYYGRTLATI